ncbi:MAG: hypothetical protein JRN10_07765 [Nitrososphaerota archaeon]|nr:hypothetical protein [Nitrososphaerota archaeon]MDG6931115.1 hypothetical protein [Nitrososphaerota archaeon]
METQKTILRSNIGKSYLLYVNEAIDESMDFNSWDNESIKKVVMLAAVTNSYVEGSSSFLDLCGNTIRYNLKQQNPDAIMEYNDKLISKMKELGVFKKPAIVAIDWHDIMFYGDPEAEGVKGDTGKEGDSLGLSVCNCCSGDKRCEVHCCRNANGL